MGAVGGFVHPMSLLQQLKEFFYWDSWIRRASEGEDLPQQHPIGPPEHTHTHIKYRLEVKWHLRPEAVKVYVFPR